MLIPAIILLLFPGSTNGLVDCMSGFVGRMEASIGAGYLTINDTSMCSASHCIKVIVHSAFDDDDTYQQGIITGCAYTGGDRQVCQRSKGTCERINFYHGMKGNFSYCCCQSSHCNTVSRSELSEIYQKNTRQKPQGNFSANWLSISLILATTTISILYTSTSFM